MLIKISLTCIIPVINNPSPMGAATRVPSMDLLANLLPVDMFATAISKKVFVFFNRCLTAQFTVGLV